MLMSLVASISDADSLVIQKSIEHWPVFVGVFLMMIWMGKWIVPNSVRASLENGGGDAVRRVVKDELSKQDDRLDKKLAAQDILFGNVIVKHEEVERVRLSEMLDKHQKLTNMSISNMSVQLKTDMTISDMKITEELKALNHKVDYVEKKLRAHKEQTSATLQAIADGEPIDVAKHAPSHPAIIVTDATPPSGTSSTLTWEPPPYDTDPQNEKLGYVKKK